MKILEPDLLWRDGRFEAGLQLEIGDDGLISRIGANLAASPSELQRLRRTALLPGMVNAHSHAFQRGLRGKAETFGSGSGTFWSWRESMYRLASSLDVERFRRLTKLAFQEMLGSGVTSVGEFHYLHHLSAESNYELDEVLLAAAREAGIRLVALDACYLTGDVGKPLTNDQRRFGSRSVEAFFESVDRLEERLQPNQTLGLVAHSLRAVPVDALVALHEAARERGVVFHMHVEEQQREIDAVVSEYGISPLALLLDRLELGGEFTAVHCTHSDPDELARFLGTGANLCVCPLTEANLADGIPPVGVSEPGASLSLGTDSNLRIDFLEEMRLLEYGQRLREQRRGVFTASDGSVANRLFQIATEGGARSLGLKTGRLEASYAADFFTVNLDAPALSETTPDDLLTAFVFGADKSVIQDVAVAGHWIR